MAATRGHAPDLDEAIEELLFDFPEAVIGIAVRDPSTGTNYDRNAQHVFHAASTMKVPVMIEAFRQAHEGRFSMETDSLTIQNEFSSIVDGQPYSITVDSDDSIYRLIGQQMSIRDLTFNMITVSSNLATNLLIDYLSPEAVQATVTRLGGDGVQVLRGVEDLRAFEAGQNNTATAAGLAAIFQALMERNAVSADADSQMVEILLEQQFTSMIPRGLGAGARFAHKTGWITAVHHDAGIVKPDDEDPYVLVIMTEGIRSEEESAELGAEIAATIHNILRGQPEAEQP